MVTRQRELILVAVPAEWVHTLVAHGAGPRTPCAGWGPVLRVGSRAEVVLALDLWGAAFHQLAELVATDSGSVEGLVAVLDAGSWKKLSVLGLSGQAVSRMLRERLAQECA